MKKFTFTAFAAIAVVAVAAGASAATRSLVLCYPGGNVKERDAKPATDQMLRVVEKLAGWTENLFTTEFTSEAEKCDTLMAANPDFAIVSLGYYLTHEDKLVAMVQPKIDGKTTETFRVLARKGTFTSMDALKGKKLGGTPFAETAFVEKVVFEGKYPLAGYTLDKSTKALKTLRDLSEGTVDAALVTDQQYSSLKSHPLNQGLEVIFTSKALPLMPMVASKTKTSADDRKKFTATMEKFCSTKDGAQFCEMFGIKGFVKTDEKTFNEARSLWK